LIGRFIGLWEYIEERVVKCAEYIVETGCTVRGCSAHFSVSKSTVHKDITERLYLIDGELYEKTRAVLNKNLSERLIRGGNATKEKYKKIQKHEE
jgi:putative DeoR family transcriptional regulator (stage III sporulation protein D)